MKIKLKYSVPLLRVFFYLLLLLSFSNEVFARGGGGGSGGGGGGGGGGFGGGGGHSSSGSSCAGSGLFLYICYGIQYSFFFIIFGFFLYSVFMRKRNIKLAKETITKAAAVDPAWNEPALIAMVQKVFIQFQNDWSNFKAEAMKQYCMPEFQKKMALDLAVLLSQNRQNWVNDSRIGAVNIIGAVDDIDNNNDHFIAEISAGAIDQLMDTKTKDILMEDRTPFTEYWTFVRDGDVWKLNKISQSTENSTLIEGNIVSFAEKNNFFYDPDFGWLMMPNKGAIFNKSNFKTSDINNHVIGVFKNKIVEFYTYIPNGNQPNTNYLVAQTTLPVNYNDILVRRKRLFWNFAPNGLRRIETESNDFNKKFCLYAHPNDQINSFVLLAPDFMEEIYNLPFELNIEIVGNFLYFYTKGRKNVNEEEMMRLLSRAFDSMRAG